MNTDIELVECVPTIDEYSALRDSAGWYPVESGYVERGLRNSLYSICAFKGNSLVGMGRVVGDGGIYYYVQDIIVLPEFQGKGIGMKIMNSVLRYIYSNSSPGAFIGLMAADGKEGFYQKFGFRRRPAEGPGMFMVMDGTGRKEQ